MTMLVPPVTVAPLPLIMLFYRALMAQKNTVRCATLPLITLL